MNYEFRKAGIYVFPLVLISVNFAVCGGTSCSKSNSADENKNIILNGTSGNITSPGFPLNLASGLSCAWKISVPKGKAIKFDFRSLKLRSLRLINNEVRVYLSNDQFKLKDPILYTYGYGARPSFVTFVPQRFALVELDLKDQMTGESGLWIVYKAVDLTKSDECDVGAGATIAVSGSEGVFISPEKYSAGKTCRWNITVPSGHVVKLQLRQTLGDKCSSSGNIYDGGSTDSKVLSNLCFKRFTPKYSSSRHVLVEFKGSTTGGQLVAFFEAVKYAPLPIACFNRKFETLTAPSGSLASSNYPLPYPNGVYCKWTIKVPLPQLVKLSFKNFSLQESVDCKKDYLQVDGDTLPGFRDRKFCGNERPGDVISIDNEMELYFKSDLVGNSQGFEATYEAIDDKTWGNCTAAGIELNTPVGHFCSPRYPKFYPPGITCTWIITAPPDHHVRLLIKPSTMPSVCAQGSLTIREGAESSGKLVKALCGSVNPPVMFSAGQHFWVQFKADPGYKQYYRGFNATYETVQSLPLSIACSSTNRFLTLEDPTGSLASDGYPNKYSNGADCSFRIKTSSSTRAITLTFESFDLEPSKGCASDYVEVFDSINALGESEGKFCGSTIPDSVTSSGQYMVVRFVTNGSGRYTGFKASYSTKLSTKYTIIIAVCSVFGAILLIAGCVWLCKLFCCDGENELGGEDFAAVPMTDMKQDC